MNRTLVALTLAVACSEADPGSPRPDPVEPPVVTSEVADTTAPSVSSTSPEDGAIGQWSSTVVTVSFSEPMDPASFEHALDAADLGEVELSWNAAGDELTVTPVDPLAYAAGPADGDVVAPSYTVVLGTGATDLAGNALDQGVSVTFATLRELSFVLDAVPELTRSLTPSELVYGVDDPLVIGDDEADSGVRAVITFDLAPLPQEAATITSATLATRQTPNETWGAPWADLGSLALDHVTYGDLDGELACNAAFNASQVALSTLPDFCVEDQVVIEADVTAEVEEDRAERAARLDRSQFLVYFPTATDLDGDTDRVVLSRELLELQVDALVP